MSSAEIGLNKSLAVSIDIVLAVGSGEDNGDGLYGVSEEFVSNSCCKGSARIEWFVGLVITELEYATIS